MKYVLAIVFFTVSGAVYADGVDAWNLNFGIGVEQYRSDYIDTARITGDEKIVVIEKVYKTKPSGWLTLSWNFWGLGSSKTETDSLTGKSIDVHNAKFGLFAGTKIIGDDSSAFGSFALGPQITFVAQDRDISIGFGWVTHQTRRFASGISEGVSLPLQYDDIVYKESTENSYMLMFSIAL